MKAFLIIYSILGIVCWYMIKFMSVDENFNDEDR